MFSKFILFASSTLLLSSCAMMDEYQQRQTGTFVSQKPSASSIDDQIESCNAGSKDACLNLVEITKKNGNTPKQYEFTLKACSLGDLASCDTQKKQDSLEAAAAKNCHEKKNGDACAQYGIARGQKGYDSEARLNIAIGCRYKSEKACVFEQQLKDWDAKQERDRDRETIERQQRSIAVQNAAYEEQRQAEAIYRAVGAAQQFFATPPPPEKRGTRCRTVVKPGNGLDGAAAYYTTDCN